MEKAGGHPAEDQREIRTPNKWINHPRSVQEKNLQSRLINPAFHLLAKNNKGEEEWDLVEREGGGELNRGIT